MRPPRPRRRDLFVGLLLLTTLAALLARGAGAPGAASCPPACPVLINEADAELLMLLPGLGPARAGRILEERGRRGPFSDGRDLVRRLPDLGPAVHRAILPFLRFQTPPEAGL